MEDFSCEHLDESSLHLLKEVIDSLNYWRIRYIQFEDDPSILINHGITKKDVWWQMIQLLPSSYNQRRTVMINYEVLVNIYRQRKGHRLDEWQTFREWIESLPYSELITLKEKG